MQQPQHDLRPFQGQANGRRIVSVGAVALLHILAIYALASGLASNLAAKIIQDVQVAVVPEKAPDVKLPPPPPPDLVKPPPPFVPPPEINVQTEAPTASAITQVTTQVAPPVKPAISQPASVGRPHTCAGRFYPAMATRLGHEGTTIVAFKIGTDGSVRDVTVTGSSGFDELDQAAIPCASSWQYKPAMQNGQPVEVPWSTKITWKLTGG